MDTATLKYEPALDGLRAIAILLVVACHSTAPNTIGGRVGVDVFFVLSGWLITNQLLIRRLALKDFYVRRARRLVPPLLALLIAYVAVAPFLLPPDPNWRANVLLAGLYLMDFAAPFGHGGGLLHTWSLALEVQFYLLWPFVLRLPRRWLTPVLMLTFCLVTLCRGWALMQAGALDPLGISPLRVSGLILGGLLAIHGHRIRLTHSGTLGGLMLLFAVLIGSGGVLGETAALTFAEVAAVLLILAATRPGPVRHMLSGRRIVHLGVLSYGLYLWHFPIVTALEPHFEWPGVLAGSLTGGLLLAEASYRWIEPRFRFAPAAQTP